MAQCRQANSRLGLGNERWIVNPNPAEAFARARATRNLRRLGSRAGVAPASAALQAAACADRPTGCHRLKWFRKNGRGKKFRESRHRVTGFELHYVLDQIGSPVGHRSRIKSINEYDWSPYLGGVTPL